MAELDITQALLNLTGMAKSLAGPQAIENGTHPHVVVPPGYQVVTLEKSIYNDYANTPHRTKQAVTVLDPTSFMSYWDVFATPASRIFADRDARRFIAVIDYHETEGPRWLSHTCTLQLRHTEEWTTWMKNNDKPMTQPDMALFIEDNAPDVINPSAASMLEIARSLEAQEASTFDSAIRLDNGDVRFSYRTETTATAAGGQIKVPNQFVLRISVFDGMEKEEFPARLRYRISSGKLSMWYSLWRYAAVEHEAFYRVLHQLTDHCGFIFVGKP